MDFNTKAEVLYDENSEVGLEGTRGYGTKSLNGEEEMFLDEASRRLATQARTIYYEAFFVVMPLFWYRLNVLLCNISSHTFYHTLLSSV
jgi:hypothetical protein